MWVRGAGVWVRGAGVRVRGAELKASGAGVRVKGAGAREEANVEEVKVKAAHRSLNKQFSLNSQSCLSLSLSNPLPSHILHNAELSNVRLDLVLSGHSCRFCLLLPLQPRRMTSCAEGSSSTNSGS